MEQLEDKPLTALDIAKGHDEINKRLAKALSPYTLIDLAKDLEYQQKRMAELNRVVCAQNKLLADMPVWKEYA